LFALVRRIATVLVELANTHLGMEPMLEVPEGRRTRNSWKRALLLGLTILLFILIYAKYGYVPVGIPAVPVQ
jgi:uncharacterized membrane protein YqjE